MAAAGSDPQAQRWLGWPDLDVERSRLWTHLLDVKPGKGGRLPSVFPDGKRMPLAAVDPSGRWLVGGIWFTPETGEVGGSLAPAFRGRGLGTALFAGAAEFGHHHLGVASVLAGTESGNAACIGALTAAGYTPAAGPETYTQPNGTVIPTRWFRHESGQPALC
jgi:RimJ/RimL family protein N-acetyltransferase